MGRAAELRPACLLLARSFFDHRPDTACGSPISAHLISFARRVAALRMDRHSYADGFQRRARKLLLPNPGHARVSPILIFITGAAATGSCAFVCGDLIMVICAGRANSVRAKKTKDKACAMAAGISGTPQEDHPRAALNRSAHQRGLLQAEYMAAVSANSAQ
ncbi:hypothetical protein K461DRAFT_116295 [Myriangium duriaei CBS 260.36]|uniref:Uncharacterized protein n=1 Tax=Myriangium duriaei CBS 260.36 TaxID=1168546 RepID=A0A9P4J2Z8_9PEZI|nr:hypothetical protein K461DRAFT_116295 [Myriangium duriaei CBS 260.36]